MSLLLVLPALIAQAPPAQAPASLETLQAQLAAIPEALVAGKAGSMKGLVAKTKAEWDKAKPGLAKTMPEAEQVFVDKQLKSMQKMKPTEQAAGALGIANTLSRFQPKPKDQGLIQARRATLLAWCSVDAAQWEPMPRVGEALKLAVDQDQGRHTLAAIGAQDALKRFEESRKKKQAVPTKKALKDLLGFFDVLAKP